MNDLFVSNGEPPAFRPDDAVPAHHSRSTVRKRRDHFAGALDELSPEIVVIVEGPNRPQELRRFFDEGVEGEWRPGVKQAPRRTSQPPLVSCEQGVKNRC